MSARFAKLFETAHGQLLVYLEESDDGEPGMTVRGAACGGVIPSAKLSWETEEKQAAAFESIDQEDAERHAKAFHEMLLGLFPKSIAGEAA